MRLSEIAAHAARGNLASGAFHPRASLRIDVIPEFYRRIGDVTWLRRPGTITVVPPGRTYDLPRDFGSMISVGGAVWPNSYARSEALRYIGEDPALVTASELSTTASSPHGYYIVPSTETKWRAIRFDAPPDMHYAVPYVYRSRLVLLNDAEDLELDGYIPEDYQPALIEGLRRELYKERYGQGDLRYGTAAAAFLEIIEQAKEGGHDLARRNYAIYCD